MPRDITVHFDDRALEVMARLQVSTGLSLEQVFRDAIGFYEWARAQVESGKAIATVDHEENAVREYILPFSSDRSTH